MSVLLPYCRCAQTEIILTTKLKRLSFPNMKTIKQCLLLNFELVTTLKTEMWCLYPCLICAQLYLLASVPETRLEGSLMVAVADESTWIHGQLVQVLEHMP